MVILSGMSVITFLLGYSVHFSEVNTVTLYRQVPAYLYAKQKHLGCKKVRGQSEATLQTGRCDQKV